MSVYRLSCKANIFNKPTHHVTLHIADLNNGHLHVYLPHFSFGYLIAVLFISNGDVEGSEYVVLSKANAKPP